MGKKIAAIDAYNAKSMPFARPILKRLRTVIHTACPTVVEEMKWHAPFFLYQERVLCATLGFKKHSAFAFWKSGLMKKKGGAKTEKLLKSLRKISDVKELPSEAVLVSLIKMAMHFNEPTTKLPPRKARSKPMKVPADFASAIKASVKAQKIFTAFSPSKQKDYIYWIIGAKTEKTRTARITTAVEWMAQGKSRGWKYEAKVKARKAKP